MNFILLSTAEWSNPFWTNKQHVAVELARLNHKVLYIDSQGIRKASGKAQDLRRIFKRLLKAFRPPYKDRGVWVWSPVPLPLRRIPFVDRLNRNLLSCGIRFWSRVLGFDAPALWTYSPLTTRQLASLRPFAPVIYHCVDDIKAQPGMPADLIEKAEQDLLRAADFVFVTSPELKTACEQHASPIFYHPNVVDFDHFNQATQDALRIPDDLAAIRAKGPVLGFVGAISGYKIDFDLLEYVATRNPHLQLVLIGKVGEGDPWTDAGKLNQLENVHLLGPRPYELLPSYLKGFDVALLPCRLNDYTKAMFPMKFFEYLAAGIPVVSVNLNALDQYGDVAGLAKDYAEFNAMVIGYVETFPANRVRSGIELAAKNTYQTRMRKMLDCIEGAKQ
ncbi:glycosyltransferase [Pontiella sp.]|uniref:glycosyltransferase n=2 Tax=Pontiella sp. TaxID=2837462 RepID=UPI003568BF79